MKIDFKVSDSPRPEDLMMYNSTTGELIINLKEIAKITKHKDGIVEATEICIGNKDNLGSIYELRAKDDDEGAPLVLCCEYCNKDIYQYTKSSERRIQCIMCS